MSQATTQYRDDWRKVIYDATGDFVKTQRAMELAELNGLFDPVDAIDGQRAIIVHKGRAPAPRYED